MGSFQEEYNKLNELQKKAVDHVDGAVLVKAGPGTGKTQLLSLRVANILRTSEVLPENILCLTFTNKASANMQARLTKLIGSSGQKVMIKTFHSFAAEVMSLYPEYFWNGATLTNVPDAVQLEIVTEILNGLPLDNPLAIKFAGQFTSTGSVLEALKLAKEAGLTPDKLRSLLHINVQYIDIVESELIDICKDKLSFKKLDEFAMRIEELPAQELDTYTRPLLALSTILQESFEEAHANDQALGKTTNTSAWKRRWVQTVEGKKGMYEERKRNDWWLYLCDVYEAYRDTLHSRGYYDYSDMIIEVIYQLEQSPDMRADIQEKFQYVLIDEFQDTNAAQLRLAHLVADHFVAEGNPNIMAVGDEDQSIYKFNGALLGNVSDFKRSYPKCQEYVLTDNYRSSQAILDFSAKVLSQKTELEAVHDLRVRLRAKNEPKTSGTISHVSFPTREHQFQGIATYVDELRKSGTVAVLARSHESLKAVAHALHTHDIPLKYEQQQNILNVPFIQQIMNICEIVTAIQEGEEHIVNEYIPKLLSHPAWSINPQKLWHLAVVNRATPHWLDTLLKSDDTSLETLGNWLLWLSSESVSQPLPRTLELIIGLKTSEHMTSPLRNYYLNTQDIDTTYLTNISAVRTLIGLTRDFCEQGESTVKDFLRLVHVSTDNNKIITDQSLFVTSADAVELLTVYKAKGLEFDSVVIVDAMESIWKPSSKGRKPPANLPLRPAGDIFDDYVRLMYVAVTRAKQNVLVTSYYTNDTGEEALASVIIRDILPPDKIPFYASNAIDVLETALSWPRLSKVNEQEILKNILEDYSLSPSAFLDFLDVTRGGPTYFMEKHLLRLPEAQSTAASFGSAIHKALELAQQQTTQSTFDSKNVLASFEVALTKQMLKKSDFEKFLVHGQQVLRRLLEEYELQLTPSGTAEVSLSVYVADVLLTGKLDRVDRYTENNILLITDYKTGTPLASFETKSKILQLKAWRHRTQLDLYTLMIEQSSLYKHSPEIRTQMIYVEAETPKELIRAHKPQSEDLEKLKKLISIVHAKITSHDLPDIKQYPANYEGVLQFQDDLLRGVI